MAVKLAVTEPSVSETDPEAKALADIVAWSLDKPGWVRDALRRLCQKDSLETSDIDELTLICIAETASFLPVTVDDIRNPGGATDTVTLQRIHGVQHVNALAEDQELTIADKGVTVIYGDNGSGKSGYARILKRICRARGKKDEIQGNIYKGSKGSPRAEIDYKVNGQNQNASWSHGTSAEGILSSISVFDTKTASVHVNEINDVAYTPFPMQILENLGQTAKEIQVRIAKNVTDIEAQTPLGLKNLRISPDTEVALALGKLSAKTKPETIDALATLTAIEEARLKALQADLADDPAKAAARLEAFKGRIEKEAKAGQALCIAVSLAAVNSLRTAYSEYESKETAARLAADKLFTESPLPQIGSDTWRALWEAARNYSRLEAYKEQPFPFTEKDSRCVLCQQELTEVGSAERLESFQKYVTDEARTQANSAKRQVDDLAGSISKHDVSISDILQTYITLRDECSAVDLALTIKRALLQAKWNRRKILSDYNKGKFSPPVEVLWPEDQMIEILATLTTRIEALRDPNQVEARKELEKEKLNLEARKWLNDTKDDVLAEIERKKKIAALTTAKKDTNPRPITDMSTSLADTLVTKALRGQFAKEIAKLEISSLAIELIKAKTSLGVPQFRVALTHKPDAKVGEILSEGEHRCIALAAFMAELATTESRSAIVFDDPVSSLDHNYRDTVAKRLASEGKNRQIIIFTHDLSFLFLVNTACKEEGTDIVFRSISRNDELAGFCNANAPPKAQPVDIRLKGLQTHLNNTKQFHGTDKWEKTVRDFIEDSRQIWERAVEDVLEPAVKRLANKVDTKGLIKVAAINDTDCIGMREVYKRCSNLIHKESDALNPPLPGPDKLQAEIDSLSKWYTDIKARQNAITQI